MRRGGEMTEDETCLTRYVLLRILLIGVRGMGKGGVPFVVLLLNQWRQWRRALTQSTEMADGVGESTASYRDFHVLSALGLRLLHASYFSMNVCASQ